MIELALEASSTQNWDAAAGWNEAARRDNTASVSERLADFARELEGAGLPWAAAGIRNVAGQIAAERRLVAQFRA